MLIGAEFTWVRLEFGIAYGYNRPKHRTTNIIDRKEGEITVDA